MDLWNPSLVIYGCPLPETGGSINQSILLGTLSAVNGQDLGGEIFPSDCWLPCGGVGAGDCYGTVARVQMRVKHL